MSDTFGLTFLGQQVAHLQAEVRTVQDEIRLVRRDIERMTGQMVTRQMLEAERDVITARLENIESEMQIGFRQLRRMIDAKVAAADTKVDTIGVRMDQQLAAILAGLAGNPTP